MQDFEKLGQFYLGKNYDFDGGLKDELLLYDSKDLTTHAVCVGMTGSGKTGLCLSLIEEALIDQVPVIAIDPKGDLANLLLTFPKLAPSDFREWIDEGSATRAGMSPDDYAAHVAQVWKEGLADWGQGPERIARLRQTADMAIYTPGSSAGLPLTVLKSFDAPAPALIEDADALRERISGTTSGLLALLGIEADPVRSREHILISNILDRVWRDGKSIDIAGMIMAIQQPPFDKVGVFDLDTFFPVKDRTELAMSLNNLLASPSFQSWMTGEPLDIKRLLHTPQGQPRLSIISIAHLSETERMFFVTILLNEVLAWVRAQEGTTTLRALLYMDEVYGYFPPVANPPSKTPMLTLLKQARAFGLGVVLATQNPVDLDYKGLSNTGTWFLGRLQTERDKARVLEGLEGASAQAGSNFDRQQMEATLAGLGNRVFLMNNVHEDEPVVFQTRWAMSYLRGPLSREHISRLMASRKQAAADELDDSAAAPAKPAERPREAVSAQAPKSTEPPALPKGVEALYVPPDSMPKGARLQYRPAALLGSARLHFVRATYKVDQWEDHRLLAEIGGDRDKPDWESAVHLAEDQLEMEGEPWEGAEFEELPGPLCSARSYSSFGRQLKDFCYQNITRSVWKCEEPKMYSHLAEEQGDFRVRLRVATHELRDEKIEKLRAKYQSRAKTIEGRIRSAEDRLAREKGQSNAAIIDTVVSVSSWIFGRKLTSSRASSSARRASNAAQQRGDVARAEERIEDLEQDLLDLQSELQKEIDEIKDELHVDELELEELSLRPRKSDIEADSISVVWLPWLIDEDGIAEAAYDLP